MRQSALAVVFGALIALSGIPMGTAALVDTAGEQQSAVADHTANETYTYRVPYALNSQRVSNNWNSDLQITATQPATSVSVDSNGDGEFERTEELSEGESITVSNPAKGTVIESTKPISTRYRYGAADFGAYEDTRLKYGLLSDRQAGEEYYVPLDTEALWVTAASNTTVRVDVDGDGEFDESRSVSAGESIKISDPAAGAHVVADDTIHAVVKRARWENMDYTYASTLLPASQARTEYQIPGEPSYNAKDPTSKSGVYIVATQDGTEVTLEGESGASTVTLDAGETQKFNVTTASTVTSSAPVVAMYTFHVQAEDWWNPAEREFIGAMTPVGETDIRQGSWGGRNWDGGISAASTYSSVTGNVGPTLRVDTQSTVEGESTTANVSLTSVPEGLQTYEVTLTLQNASVARVGGISAGAIGGNAFEIIDQTDDSITFRAADFAGAVQAEDGPVTLATLELTDTSAGNTTFSVSVSQLTNDNGSEIPAEVRTTALIVDGHPFSNGIPGIASDRPTDPDGDGLYEDVNGDGAVTFEDANALAFANTDDLSERQVAALDFDGDGDLDFDDAVELAFST